MNKITVVFMIILLLGLLGCRRGEGAIPEENTVDEQSRDADAVSDETVSESVLDVGGIIEDVYVNDFFELEIVLPDEWTILSLEALDRILHAGEKVIGLSDEALAKELAGSENVSLLGVFRYPLTVQTPYNASLVVSAEKTGLQESQFDGIAELERTMEKLVASGVPYGILDNRGTVTINNRVYGTLSAEIEAGDQVIVQDYYVKATKGYVLTIVMTYVDDADKGVLRQMLGLE